MKKTLLTIAIVLGLATATFADPNGSGLFQRGIVTDEEYYGASSYFNRNNDLDAPGLPYHDLVGNQDAPLGSGIAMLTALGVAYLIGKKRREE